MYGFSGYHKYKTQQLKDWETEAGWEITKKWRKETICTPVYCGITLFYKRNRDIDNLKAIPDLLQDMKVIENDMLIEHMDIKKVQDKEKPRVEIEIKDLES